MADDQLVPEREARYRWSAELIAGGRVLDAACGAGWGTEILARRASKVVGIDLSPAAVAAAREMRGRVADFREGDLRSLPFDDGEFDHVVCFEAISHTPDPAHVISELRRVIRGEGLLLLSAPNRGVYPPGNPLHLSEASSAELEQMLSARFANVAMYRQHSYFTSLLCDDALLAHRDRERSVSSSWVKTTGGPPGSELYAVAAATDGELPQPPAMLVLGDQVDYRAQQEQLEEWQARAIEAEAKLLTLERELRALQS